MLYTSRIKEARASFPTLGGNLQFSYFDLSCLLFISSLRNNCMFYSMYCVLYIDQFKQLATLNPVAASSAHVGLIFWLGSCQSHILARLMPVSYSGSAHASLIFWLGSCRSHILARLMPVSYSGLAHAVLMKSIHMLLSSIQICR